MRTCRSRRTLRGDRLRSMKPASEASTRQPPDATPRSARDYVKSIVLLLVGALALHLFLPSLVAVFSSWRSLEDLVWPFAILVFLSEGMSSVCLWELDRIALGVEWSWRR
jgi:hypothetical protein